MKAEDGSSSTEADPWGCGGTAGSGLQPPPAPALQGGVAEVVPILVGGAAGSMAMWKSERADNCLDRRVAAEVCEVVDLYACGDSSETHAGRREVSTEQAAAFEFVEPGLPA